MDPVMIAGALAAKVVVDMTRYASNRQEELELVQKAIELAREQGAAEIEFEISKFLVEDLEIFYPLIRIPKFSFTKVRVRVRFQ